MSYLKRSVWAALTITVAGALGRLCAYTGELPLLQANIGGVTHYMQQWMFADVAGLWNKNDTWAIPGNVNGDPSYTSWDENGYPLSIPSGGYVECYPFFHNGGKYPLGEYVLTWDGEGVIELTIGGVTLVSEEPGRKVYNVAEHQGKGIRLRISETDPNNHIRNVHLWMPGTENRGSMFHPLFIQRLKPFGVLRFMGALNTNHSIEVHWEDRKKPTEFFKCGSRGIAKEYAIDICNEVDADFWVNIPCRATDDYVRQFATLIRDRLNPHLRVWVEWGNENAWNYHRAECDSIAALRGLADGHAANGRRAIEVCDIFTEVFGGTDRLVRLIAGQANSAQSLQKGLAAAASYAGPDPLNTRIDVATVAHYYTRGSETLPLIWENRYNPDKSIIWDDLYHQIDVDSGPLENKVHADNFGLPMVAYEGGEHLNGVALEQQIDGAEWDTLLPAIFEIVRDPRFVELTHYALNWWRTNGFETFSMFSYCSDWSKYGSWGHLEYQDQSIDSATKYRAVITWQDSVAGTDWLSVVSPTTVAVAPRQSRHGPVLTQSSPVSARTFTLLGRLLPENRGWSTGCLGQAPSGTRRIARGMYVMERRRPERRLLLR
ncbi:MAG: hypothetical protein GF331_10450 [Chitinivibrionales bacterium]|nr:hypothetical protein [Chitinivibrionales bacterium]